MIDAPESRSSRRERQKRALWVVLIANGSLVGAEAVGGLVFGSLALLADAVHGLTDVSGLAIALLAIRLSERPATARHTYGLQRAEVLAAQGNALILLGTTGWVFFEAVRRLVTPVPVVGEGLLGLASLALLVNLGSVWLLAHVPRGSLNIRGALLHLLSDAAGSLGAMVAGAIVLLWGVERADPLISIGIGLLVLWAAWRLVRDAVHVLLEGTPRGLDPREVEQLITSHEGVESIHDLHLWSLASDVPALSAHVVLPARDDITIHDAEARRERLKALLSERFGIEHATLEIECHPEHDDGRGSCAPPGQGEPTGSGPATGR